MAERSYIQEIAQQGSVNILIENPAPLSTTVNIEIRAANGIGVKIVYPPVAPGLRRSPLLTGILHGLKEQLIAANNNIKIGIDPQGQLSEQEVELAFNGGDPDFELVFTPVRIDRFS